MAKMKIWNKLKLAKRVPKKVHAKSVGTLSDRIATMIDAITQMGDASQATMSNKKDTLLWRTGKVDPVSVVSHL